MKDGLRLKSNRKVGLGVFGDFQRQLVWWGVPVPGMVLSALIDSRRWRASQLASGYRSR
jgi:hypothetical protein